MTVTMKTATLFALAITSIAAGTVNRLPVQPESKVWVSGSSTVRDYKCNAVVIDATVMAPTAETASTPIGQLVASAEIAIPLAQLDCGNETMNEHMRKALKAKEAPRVTFKLENYKENAGEIQLNGTLNIAGTERPIQLLGAVTDTKGVVRAVGKAQIRMSEWGVKPPTLMLGSMKVKDNVTINFDVVLKR
jgi:polyisoprenoid-binding protein YceI